ISLGAQQRHSSSVCVARGRARALRSIAASSRNHKSAVEHTRRSAPEPSLGSSRQLPYDLRAILRQALTRALAERGQRPQIMAKLHRPPAPDLARQRSFKCFRTRFTRDLRQSSSISVYAIAEEASAPEIVVRTFGSTQKKVHPRVRVPGPKKVATKRRLWIEPGRHHQVLFLARSLTQQMWRLSLRPLPLGQAVSSD